jgi:hypothetical protein
MSQKMKFYIGRIFERNGDYEYNQTIFFKLSSRKSPQKYLNDMAANQYSASKYPEGDGWYFNCGEVYVESQGYREISEATYNEINASGYS